MAQDLPNARGPDAVTHQLPTGELPAGWPLLGGQYEITRLIAAGGFGITYLARDTLGRDVAVKECFPLGLAQRAAATHTVSATSAGMSEHFETARAQFLREARMLAALRHPNVVHVQTLFEENGTAYMAMDFIHGRDLQEEIVAGTIPPPRVLDLARDLLGALEYVHAQSILHRDIKPQNIRIDRFGVPMLIDFGAARAETQARSRMAGTFRVVTDGYSPHEFYVSGAAQGPHSDLYALAATLHHVITGAAPVAADERASRLCRRNCRTEDEREDIGNLTGVHNQYVRAGGQIQHYHDRYQATRDCTDSFNAADDDHPDYDGHEDSGGDTWYAKVLLCQSCNIPGLEHVAAGDCRYQQRDAEQYAEKTAQAAQFWINPPQTLVNDPHRTAMRVVRIFGIAIEHRQCDFGELDGHPEKADDPHPEHRAWSTQCYSNCDTTDITQTDRGRQRRGQGLEVIDRAGIVRVVIRTAQDLGAVCQCAILRESADDCQDYARRQKYIEHIGVP